jgi:acyl carrier protein
MTLPNSTATRLRTLPAAARREALEMILDAEFRAALLMTDDDELPFDRSYFDLGLTSLGLTDLKDRLQTLLGCEIDTTELFNSPTIEHLLDHLTEQGRGEGHVT